MLKVLRTEDLEVHRLGEGSTVKPIIDSMVGAGNVAMGWVSFDPGSATPDHVRDVEEIIYVLKGRAAIVAGSQEYLLDVGDTIFIPPGVTHRHENRGSGVVEQLYVFAPQGPEGTLRDLPVVAS